jgi:hypothetical protein
MGIDTGDDKRPSRSNGIGAREVQRATMRIDLTFTRLDPSQRRSMNPRPFERIPARGTPARLGRGRAMARRPDVDVAEPAKLRLANDTATRRCRAWSGDQHSFESRILHHARDFSRIRSDD